LLKKSLPGDELAFIREEGDYAAWYLNGKLKEKVRSSIIFKKAYVKNIMKTAS
jgi:hypothetical protein